MFIHGINATPVWKDPSPHQRHSTVEWEDMDRWHHELLHTIESFLSTAHPLKKLEQKKKIAIDSLDTHSHHLLTHTGVLKGRLLLTTRLPHILTHSAPSVSSGAMRSVALFQHINQLRHQHVLWSTPPHTTSWTVEEILSLLDGLYHLWPQSKHEYNVFEVRVPFVFLFSDT